MADQRMYPSFKVRRQQASTLNFVLLYGPSSVKEELLEKPGEASRILAEYWRSKTLD